MKIGSEPDKEADYWEERKFIEKENARRFLNGYIFSKYLLVIKEVLYTRNQNFFIQDYLISQIIDKASPTAK